ncbi:hypothetical protein VTJ04DRAFT_6076 [Mycothermus thermophilus]|uniref:uncharacterized protein n=1 Tax=Humicola insolens TaxID=85995 RepID=UPI003743EFA4
MPVPAPSSSSPPNPAVPRFSCDSDRSSGSTVRDLGAASPPVPRGLRPPPARHHLSRSLTGSQIFDDNQDEIRPVASNNNSLRPSEKDEDGISPLLSRAPHLPDPKSNALGIITGDIIPKEPTTSSLPAPRTRQLTPPTQPTNTSNLPSHLTTVLDNINPDKQTKRKPLPPPRIIIPSTPPTSPPTRAVRRTVEEAMAVASAGAASVAGSIVILATPSTTTTATATATATASGGIPPFPPLPGKEAFEMGSMGGVGSPGSNKAKSGKGAPGSKRKTMRELIDGWWDLGLLERMGTVRRKK